MSGLVPRALLFLSPLMLTTTLRGETSLILQMSKWWLREVK